MAQQVFPTKANLLNAKKSLSLSQLGYELLDRKRNVLVREMMQLIDTAKFIRGGIESTYKDAYIALQDANIGLGVIDSIANSTPIENGISVQYRSVMGVELPKITLEEKALTVPYGFYQTDSHLDKAYISFQKVKEMTIILAEVENSIYRLANAIKKTQRRANALKNVLIPRFEETVKFITNSLEEKEREEFSRLKVIKVQKNQNI